MTEILRLALLLTISCCPAFIIAQETSKQDIPPLAKKLENVFEEKEPKWKIERPYVQMSPPVMHLRSVDGDVLIYFWIMDDELNAKAVFDGEVVALGNILGTRKKEIKLPDLGDDNRLSRDRSGSFATLVFRKDKTFIKVAAPSEVIAKRFAGHVFDQIVAPKPESASSRK
jgi:hypothetical protein